MPTQQDFEHCRTFRHSWEVLDTASGHDPFAGYVRALRLRCIVCTTRRNDELDAGGELVSREYTYPEGYRYGKDDERYSLQTLRLRLLLRLDEKETS